VDFSQCSIEGSGGTKEPR